MLFSCDVEMASRISVGKLMFNAVNTPFCFTVDYSADLVWGHTTESMCIGYMAEQDKKPKVKK